MAVASSPHPGPAGFQAASQPVQQGPPSATRPASREAILAEPCGSARARLLSILVPVRDEGGNVEPLVARLEGALAGLDVEVVFIDDGDDDLGERVARLAGRSSLSLRHLARPPGRRPGGLGGAVEAGLGIASGRWICVMDGDLQHPPELIPHLLGTAQSAPADLVLASRFARGAASPGLSPARRLTSRILALLMRALFLDQLAGVTDPLTGFFLVRRAALDLRHIQADGFKILLQILVASPGLVVAEVPFRFAAREADHSKASFYEVVRLGRTVARLSRRAHGRLARFLAVGASGFAVNNLAMAALVEGSATHYLAAAAAATAITTCWNFLLTELWVFRDRNRRGERGSRFAAYAGVSVLGLALRSPLLFVLTSVLGIHYLTSNALSIVALTGIRYALSARWIWRPPTPVVEAGVDEGASS